MTVEQGTIVGSYQVEGVLGRGATASVYAARHQANGRLVALKLLSPELGADPQFVARFRREGRLQASLEHPHVVTVYEAGESEHGLFLAMRLVAGSTLAALLAERALTIAQALALLRQAAEALDAAHAAGLIHRDVKPQNVLVGEADDAYLGDFGLTRLGDETELTAAGTLLGTVAYLAPEVIEGQKAIPASDRYAFAAMVFQALSGTTVFPWQSTAAVLHAHVSEPPPPISSRRAELPAALDQLFARALSKDPRERPGSAVAFVDAVAAALSAAHAMSLAAAPPPGGHALGATTAEPQPYEPPPLHTPEAPPQPQRLPRASRSNLALIAAALCGAAVAAGVTLAADSGDSSTITTTTAPIIPPPLPGARALGSDLRSAGRTVDCHGRPPRLSAPSCTVVQTSLPGKMIAVPGDGVIRRWAIRSAKGEFALVVVRPRGNGGKQVERSENEFASTDGGVHVFPTDLAVQQGDLVGLVVVPGSGVGVRPGPPGTATKRWIPRLKGTQPPTLGPGTGFDRELLLRVDYIPGGTPRKPSAVSGAAARTAQPGHVEIRRQLRFGNGRPVEVDLVRLGSRLVLDELIRGRRVARTDVPDLRAQGGRVITFEVYAETDVDPQTLGIYIEYANEESARIISHFYLASPSEFDFFD